MFKDQCIARWFKMQFHQLAYLYDDVDTFESMRFTPAYRHDYFNIAFNRMYHGMPTRRVS